MTRRRRDAEWNQEKTPRRWKSVGQRRRTDSPEVLSRISHTPPSDVGQALPPVNPSEARAPSTKAGRQAKAPAPQLPVSDKAPEPGVGMSRDATGRSVRTPSHLNPCEKVRLPICGACDERPAPITAKAKIFRVDSTSINPLRRPATPSMHASVEAGGNRASGRLPLHAGQHALHCVDIELPEP